MSSSRQKTVVILIPTMIKLYKSHNVMQLYNRQLNQSHIIVVLVFYSLTVLLYSNNIIHTSILTKFIIIVFLTLSSATTPALFTTISILLNFPIACLNTSENSTHDYYILSHYIFIWFIQIFSVLQTSPVIAKNIHFYNDKKKCYVMLYIYDF